MRQFVADRVYRSVPYELRRRVIRLLSPRRYREMVELQSKGRENKYPFDEYETIFIHIPKTGGLAVCSGLFGSQIGGHRTLRQYELIYDKSKFDRYFKFCFVRNPWERLASAYFFLKKGGINNKDKKWFDKYISHFQTFPEFIKGWVTSENVRQCVHFRQQIQFIESAPSQIAVDFVGRFENLVEDYEFVRKQLGIGVPLPIMNVNPHPKSSYDSESAEIVSDVFRDDILAFGYESDGPVF